MFTRKAKFLAAVAAAMRHLLVDHARALGRQKRGGRPKKVTLSEGVLVGKENVPDLLDLDEALAKLAKYDASKKHK